MDKFKYYIIKIFIMLLLTGSLIVFGIFRINNKHHHNIY